MYKTRFSNRTHILQIQTLFFYIKHWNWRLYIWKHNNVYKKTRCKVCYERNNGTRSWRISQKLFMQKASNLTTQYITFPWKIARFALIRTNGTQQISAMRSRNFLSVQKRAEKNSHSNVEKQNFQSNERSSTTEWISETAFFYTSFPSMSAIKALTQGQRVRSEIRDWLKRILSDFKSKQQKATMEKLKKKNGMCVQMFWLWCFFDDLMFFIDLWIMFLRWFD